MRCEFFVPEYLPFSARTRPFSLIRGPAGGAARFAIELLDELLSTFQVFLHGRLGLLSNLCQLALRLLANYFQSGQGMRVRRDGGAHKALVKFGARFLLQVFFDHLRFAVDDLPIDFRDLLDGIAAAAGVALVSELAPAPEVSEVASRDVVWLAPDVPGRPLLAVCDAVLLPLLLLWPAVWLFVLVLLNPPTLLVPLALIVLEPEFSLLLVLEDPRDAPACEPATDSSC